MSWANYKPSSRTYCTMYIRVDVRNTRIHVPYRSIGLSFNCKFLINKF